MVDLLNPSVGRYLEQALTEYDRDIIKTVTAPAWATAGQNHATRGDLPRGLLKLTSTIVQTIGDAGIYDGKTIDIPMVDYSMDGADFTALRFIVGTKWSEDEIDSWQLASRAGLPSTLEPILTKMEAMQDILDLKMHRTILFGSKARNFKGWFTNGTVPIAAAVPAVKPLIMTNTALYDWFSGILTEFSIKNALNPMQITAFVDPRFMRKLHEFLEGGSRNTVAEQILSTNTQAGLVKDIRSIYELTPEVIQANTANLPNAVAAGTGRIILGCYDDPKCVLRRYYPSYRTTPEKLPGTFNWVVLMSSGTTELMHKKLLNFSFIDYSTALV